MAGRRPSASTRRDHPQVRKLPSSVVLTGVLSDPEFGLFFQSLTSSETHKESRTCKAQPTGSPDGRRKFGSVSGAILQVLMEAQSDLRVKEIRVSVERLLGSSVSRHSIKSYLHERSFGRTTLMARLR